jgi:hypothetical protein
MSKKSDTLEKVMIDAAIASRPALVVWLGLIVGTIFIVLAFATEQKDVKTIAAIGITFIVSALILMFLTRVLRKKYGK